MKSEAFPFGPFIDEDEIRFSLWAPGAENVELSLESRCIPMQPLDHGWWQLSMPRSRDPESQPGSPYQFRINNDLHVPDPASRKQLQDVHGPSCIPLPEEYPWQCSSWKGLAWEQTVIYELHVGSFSPEGNFAGVQKRLPYLRDLGVTAIELMPVADFPGKRNWGYDGVLHYAPDTSYGSPEELKELIDAAHSMGIMVFLDVVYNHFGPDGNYLHVYAEDFFTDRVDTPWGPAIDFSQRPVREFFIQNAEYWLSDFRFDGLRFDAVQEIHDEQSEEHFLLELSRRIRESLPEDRIIHLMLENDDNQARYLDDSYRAQWNDDYHHVMHSILSGESGGYYSDFYKSPFEKLQRTLTEGFIYQNNPSEYRDGKLRGEDSSQLPPSAFINFLQNHDQTGNRAFGERIHMLSDSRRLQTARAAMLLLPQIPMLFMGDEWQADSPFLFFCDFHNELADAVRKGRREEFSKFPAFADPEVREQIPDPNAEDTFLQSCLDWNETQKQPHSECIEETRQLLELRRKYISPLLPGIYASRSCVSQTVENEALVICWHIESTPALIVEINLGNKGIDCCDELQKLGIENSEMKKIWDNSSPSNELFELVPGSIRVWAAAGSAS